MTRLLFFLCALAVLTSCQKEEFIPLAGSGPDYVTPTPPGSGNASLKDVLVASGGMRITRFVEEGKDGTSKFKDYVFVFSANGSVKAEKGNGSVIGSYKVFFDDGKLELGMDFPKGSGLHELADDWYFISQDPMRLYFADGPDVLEFQVVSGQLDTVTVPSPGTGASAVYDTLLAAKEWRISSFIEEGKDGTSKFKDIVLSFDAGGVVTAQGKGSPVKGSFLVFHDDGKTELGMDFPKQGPLHELTDDWYFILQDAETLLFADGGDILELKRN